MMHRRKVIIGAALLSFVMLVSGCGTEKAGNDAGSFSDAVTITNESSSGRELVIETPADEPIKEQLGDEQPLGQLNEESELVKSVQPASEITDIAEETIVAVSDSVVANSPPINPIEQVTDEGKYPSITWSGFFDNDDQTTPSEEFWDLSEASTTVQIKGFMGEILSIDKNWFLLIPEPGAECPFDNGDETYWNKIMIVFVEDGTKLRYTSKPLIITGRLDVGIKIDESSYKTMFRLYDAKLEEITE